MYPSHIVAKWPKIRGFGSTAKAREGFGKLIDELANTMKYYRHPGVHRISGVRVGSWLAVLDISIPDWHAF
jgi:hypothetical protein